MMRWGSLNMRMREAFSVVHVMNLHDILTVSFLVKHLNEFILVHFIQNRAGNSVDFFEFFFKVGYKVVLGDSADLRGLILWWRNFSLKLRSLLMERLSARALFSGTSIHQ